MSVLAWSTGGGSNGGYMNRRKNCNCIQASTYIEYLTSSYLKAPPRFLFVCHCRKTRRKKFRNINKKIIVLPFNISEKAKEREKRRKKLIVFVSVAIVLTTTTTVNINSQSRESLMETVFFPCDLSDEASFVVLSIQFFLFVLFFLLCGKQIKSNGTQVSFRLRRIWSFHKNNISKRMNENCAWNFAYILYDTTMGVAKKKILPARIKAISRDEIWEKNR